MSRSLIGEPAACRARSEPILRPGNTNCGGCGMSIGLNMLSRAVGDTPIQIVIPACCGIVTPGHFPNSAYGAPVVASTCNSKPYPSASNRSSSNPRSAGSGSPSVRASRVRT